MPHITVLTAINRRKAVKSEYMVDGKPQQSSICCDISQCGGTLYPIYVPLIEAAAVLATKVYATDEKPKALERYTLPQSGRDTCFW